MPVKHAILELENWNCFHNVYPAGKENDKNLKRAICLQTKNMFILSNLFLLLFHYILW